MAAWREPAVWAREWGLVVVSSIKAGCHGAASVVPGWHRMGGGDHGSWAGR